MKARLIMTLAVVLALGAFAEEQQEEGKGSQFNPRLSTDDVGNQQIMDRKANPLYESRLLGPIGDSRDAFAKDTGLSMNLDYTALFMGLSDAVAGADKDAGSGMARFYGTWALVDRGGPNSGTLSFKIEHRHKYGDKCFLSH